jgi:hypothetical protein
LAFLLLRIPSIINTTNSNFFHFPQMSTTFSPLFPSIAASHGIFNKLVFDNNRYLRLAIFKWAAAAEAAKQSQNQLPNRLLRHHLPHQKQMPSRFALVSSTIMM